MRNHYSRMVLAAVIAVALLVSACQTVAPQTGAEQPAAAAPSTEPVEIQVYYPIAVDAPIAEILNGYIAEFETENPNISVEPVFSGGYTDVQTAIQTVVGGGGTPPAVGVMLATSLYDLINADLIVPLDQYVAEASDGQAYIDDFLPAFLANSRYEDQLWSIPFQRSAVVLYYNADMFKEAGLEPPTSWQTWAEAAQKLTTQEGDQTLWGLHFSSDWPYWLFQPLAIGNGQNVFNDACSVAFDDPKVVEALQFYIDLSHEYNAMPTGVQASWATDPADFTNGAVAMIAHTTGSLSGILKQAGFEVGLMPYPGHEEGSYASVPGGGNFYILKGASQEQQDAAWKFIEFMTQPEQVADYSIQTGYIATRNAAYDTQALTDYMSEVPQAQAARDALGYAQAELATQDLGEVLSIFHNYLQKAINGEMSAADAMAAAQEEATTALQPFCE